MTKPISKIQMAGFRGAIGEFELQLDQEKDLTMLFGENGSGKSTILDAIDVVCNRTIGCLEGVSVGQAPGRFLCAVGIPPDGLIVRVHSNDEQWSGTLLRNSMNVVGPEIKPKVKILRRNRILKLVQAEPNERYKELQHFIDIPVVEQSEVALKQKLVDTARSIERHAETKSRLLGHLENLWQEEERPGPGESAAAWAEAKLGTGIEELKDTLTRLKDVVDKLSATDRAKKNYAAKTNRYQDLEQQLARAEDAIASAPTVSPHSAVKLLESLEKARDYINSVQALEACPTCQRPIERDELLVIVDEQFKQLSVLKSLSDQKNSVKAELGVAAAQKGEAAQELITALQEIRDLSQEGSFQELESLRIQWPEWTTAHESMETLLGLCAQLEVLFAPLEQLRDEAQKDVSQFNSIKEWWNGITDAKDELANLFRLREGLGRAHEIVHEKRVRFTQGILDEICEEANRLFQILHPGENIGLEHLRMEAQRRSSVSQTAMFHGQGDIPPQAVFSDSHLDTLGFCVWLALAKADAPAETVLLIDDVFSSVDAQHLGRVVEVFDAESSNFLQVIVATHFRLWWDRCQRSARMQRVQLGTWSPISGIAALELGLVTEQLRIVLGERVLDRQSVSSKAGILLESILDELALLYRCSLPRNKLNQYTLGDLLSASSRIFERHNLNVQVNLNWNSEEAVENWEPTPAKRAFDRINALQFIRNQVGCHFNESGMEISDREIREFGTSTVQLFEALTCPNCGAVPTKLAKDGTHLRCSCTKRAARMTPVAIQ